MFIAPTQGKWFSVLAPAPTLQMHCYTLNLLVRRWEQALLQHIFILVKIQWVLPQETSTKWNTILLQEFRAGNIH